MNAIAVFLMFVGMFLVVQGFYDHRSKCPEPKTQVKYIPMTLYEQQLADDPSACVSNQFKSLFEDVSTWPTLRG